MSARERILEATAELLVASPGGDVSTRAICERADVAAPALYRAFGDKRSLFAAVVDQAFESYLSHKRHAEPHSDPLSDLRDGWDSHTSWAIAHPAFYELIYGQRGRDSEAAGEAFSILHRDVDRAARAGLMRVDPAVGAQMIMAANVGTALMCVLRPDLFAAQSLSALVRDAMHSAVFAENNADSGPIDDLATPAATLASRLSADSAPMFRSAEMALLRTWLGELTMAPTLSAGQPRSVDVSA